MVGILTYNIHSGVGTNGAYDLERVAGVIRRSKADIACLQEAAGVTGALDTTNSHFKKWLMDVVDGC